MGNKNKNFKKCRRKIRIRLADPNDPESYVCEVFDSSFEYDKEDSDVEDVKFLKKSGSKPKNYFELLMSKNCRRNSKIKRNARMEENHEKVSAGKLLKKGKNCSTPAQESDSSDDENLLQLKKKCQDEVLICEKRINKTEESDEELIFEPTKIQNKKSLNLLNYFTKTNSKNKISKASQRKSNGCEKAENSNLKKFNVSELNKENLKLAPLFCKKEKKIFDLAEQKARQEFLFSSSAVAKKENKNNDSSAHFYEVAHVQQKNYSPCWSVRDVVLPLPRIPALECVPESDRTFRFNIQHPSAIRERVQCENIEINEQFINKLKSKYINLNLDSMIDNFKRKRDEYLSLAEELEKSKNVQSVDETNYEALNTLWVEKYKPKSSDILGNGKTIKKLRSWLESWKVFNEGSKALIKSKLKTRADSDDDYDAFYDSDDDGYGIRIPKSVCILLGPHASGKTALVFALANELEFKVLELNASSKRSGKKVLADLQEATQSHKVHHLNAFKNMPGRERKKKRRRKGKKWEDSAKAVPPNGDCKISLILIEDADIVFEEHDEGFISAINFLVRTSKRPLIFVAQEPKCAYLQNIKKEKCLILKMERPCLYESCAVLDIVSSLEGAQTEEDFLKNLIRRNHFDLRKSLLELQFWLQSRENPATLQTPFDLGKLWWGLGRFLYKNDLKLCLTSKGCKRKRHNDLFDSSDNEEESVVKKPKLNSGVGDDFVVSNQDTVREKSSSIMESYSRILDVVSVLDTVWGSSRSELIFCHEPRPKDGISLEENLEEVSCERNFRESVSEEMVRLSTGIFAKDLREKKHEERKFDFSSLSWEDIRWQELQTKASEKISSFVPLHKIKDTRSLRLDYLPIIRDICRLERIRQEKHPKRRNRFYHYLWRSGPPIDDDNLDANIRIFSR